MPNEYDNEVLFAQYAQMDRSKGGLEAAGEWLRLKPLFPSLDGMAVLDLGCGYGWHCITLRIWSGYSGISGGRCGPAASSCSILSIRQRHRTQGGR